MTSSSKPIYFFSDVHLGVGDQDALKNFKLKSLLDLAATNNAECFILGDLFDFWFEFFSGIPNCYKNTLNILCNAVSKGTKITFIGGNHDYWVGKNFIKKSGCQVLKKPFLGTIANTRIYAGHGDGLAKSDWAYRLILKPFLRCPASILLFKLFPRKIGQRIACGVSNGSRIYTKNRNLKFEAEYLDTAQKIAKNGIEFVIVGHTHEPARIVRLENTTYVNLGDFFSQFTYAVLDKGKIRIDTI